MTCTGILIALLLAGLAAHIASGTSRHTHLEPDDYYPPGTLFRVQAEDGWVVALRMAGMFALIILATAVLTLLFQGAG